MDYRDYELKHYGVIGMKWGVRKADKRGTKFDYRSMQTKQMERKADVYRDKGDRKKSDHFKKEAAISKYSDKQMYNYSQLTSAGATAARHVLMGPFASRAYEQSRAAGYSKGKSLAISAIGQFGGMGLGVATVITRNKMRKDYESGKR